MARVGRLHGVHAQRPDRVDGQLLDGRPLARDGQACLHGQSPATANSLQPDPLPGHQADEHHQPDHTENDRGKPRRTGVMLESSTSSGERRASEAVRRRASRCSAPRYDRGGSPGPAPARRIGAAGPEDAESAGTITEHRQRPRGRWRKERNGLGTAPRTAYRRNTRRMVSCYNVSRRESTTCRAPGRIERADAGRLRLPGKPPDTCGKRYFPIRRVVWCRERAIPQRPRDTALAKMLL